MPAYNPYFPATYQPVYQQPYQMPTYQQPIQQTQQTSIIWISGEREALAYPVAPNNAVTLWSQSEPVVYLKSADATGKPSLKAYDLVERVSGASGASSHTEVKTDTFATKDDLGAILGALKGYDGTISTLKADIDQIKGDVYGLAGKKKVKKVEDDE